MDLDLDLDLDLSLSGAAVLATSSSAAVGGQGQDAATAAPNVTVHELVPSQLRFNEVGTQKQTAEETLGCFGGEESGLEQKFFFFHFQHYVLLYKNIANFTLTMVVPFTLLVFYNWRIISVLRRRRRLTNRPLQVAQSKAVTWQYFSLILFPNLCMHVLYTCMHVLYTEGSHQIKSSSYFFFPDRHTLCHAMVCYGTCYVRTLSSPARGQHGNLPHGCFRNRCGTAQNVS